MTHISLKACILAAGEGKRLAPLTDTRPKPLISVAGKPLLQYTIEFLKSNGITEILLIVGYRRQQIEEYFQDGAAFGVHISYIEQQEFLGTGHATHLAKSFAGTAPFLLIYGDLFMAPEIIQEAIRSYSTQQFDGIITAKEMPDPTKWGILKTDTEGNLELLVEKPSDGRFGNLANAGVYIFSPSIFDGIEKTAKSVRGEYELTDSILHSIQAGQKFHVVNITQYYWSDVGHPWQFLEATQHVISQMPQPPADPSGLVPPKIINHGGFIEDFVSIHGAVEIGKGTIIKSGSYLEGPLTIGEHCVIGPNSYLRPFTSLGNFCKIGNGSEIKGSIIMDHTAIPHLSYIGDSIIGEHVNFGCGSITANLRLDKGPIAMEIKGDHINTQRKKLGAIVGDYAQLGIQVSIMPGKSIGAHAKVGSHTVVAQNVPSYATVYATQACQMRKDPDSP